MNSHIPKILLIGRGRFGRRHLRVWRELERQGKVNLVDVITKSTSAKLTPALLKSVNAVDIVTPTETHYELVKKCLRYCHVFVEKPLAHNAQAARALSVISRGHKKVLSVGHIYRFHPLTKTLKRLLSRSTVPLRVGGVFTAPLSSWCQEYPAFEMLHWFDVLDFLFGLNPSNIWTHGVGQIVKTSLRYKNKFDANMVLGWRGKTKERKLLFHFSDRVIEVDFVTKEIRIVKESGTRVIKHQTKTEPLRTELEHFLQIIFKPRPKDIISADVGVRVVKIAERATRTADHPKKSVAVIGGGIFGLTAAVLLSDKYRVTIFERHKDIMTEASYNNQYRHHAGYHYPRSLSTVAEIQAATSDFEQMYGNILIRDWPSYYAVSKTNSYITAGQFRQMCNRMRLPLKLEYPPDDWLNKESVATCGRTTEAVIDYDKMKNWLGQKIKNKKIELHTGAEIVNAKLLANGIKELLVGGGNKQKCQAFDYVVNATYANYNQFCHWLGFPKKEIELRLKEVIMIRLPENIKPVAVTVVDGPFVTIVPTGWPSLYTFGDVPLSVLKVSFGQKGAGQLERLLVNTESRWPEMKERCLKWCPILKQAEYVRSMFAILPVEMAVSKIDARPTDVVDHGFGCYSIFSGKIITAVTAAKQLVNLINNGM